MKSCDPKKQSDFDEAKNPNLLCWGDSTAEKALIFVHGWPELGPHQLWFPEQLPSMAQKPLKGYNPDF